MTVKEKVLLLLEKQKGNALSGQELAEELGVTRASVWKAVKALVKDGYAIEAVNNKGYTLKKAPDILSAAYIEQGLKKESIMIDVKVERNVTSTNTRLKQYVAEGQTKDMVLLAEEQSAGKGRRGRSFFSPEGTGLYMSLLLHPDVEPEEATMLTTLAAAAEAVALEKITEQSIQIKWVNDVCIRGKKISGILTEGSASMEERRMEYVIVGIGINIYEPEEGFPEEIKEVAGAVFTNDISRDNLRNQIATEVLLQFMKFYKNFPQRTYFDEYRKRSAVIGKDVRIITPNGETIKSGEGEPDRGHAHVLGINDQCHLHVCYSDGVEEFLSSGEISVRL